MKIAFDIELMRPGSDLIQVAMGGTEGIANRFDTEDWIEATSTDMKLYEVTDEQLIQLVQKVEGRESSINE